MISNPWLIALIGGVVSSTIAALLVRDLGGIIGRPFVLDNLPDNGRRLVKLIKVAVVVDIFDSFVSVVNVVGRLYGIGTNGYVVAAIALLINLLVKLPFLIYYMISSRDLHGGLVFVINEAICTVLPFGQLLNLLPLYHYLALRQFFGVYTQSQSKDERAITQ